MPTAGKQFLKFQCITRKRALAYKAHLRRDIMDQRTTHLLTGIMLFGLASTALPQAISFAQSDPFVGTWQLNLAKSEFNIGRPPKALTINVQGEGQNRKATVVGFDAAGNPLTWGFMFIHDSQPHPVTGAPFEDAMVYTPVDDHTVSWTATKGGQVVLTGTETVSRDGKTFTITTAGFDVNGRPTNNITVYDKQ
jgi:hypothetical protein